MRPFFMSKIYCIPAFHDLSTVSVFRKAQENSPQIVNL